MVIYRTKYSAANNPIPIAIAANQAPLCHPKIFAPSNGPNGIRLKTANQILIRAPNEKSNMGYAIFNRRNTSARQRFITGPVIEINPTVRLFKVTLPRSSALGYIITAPGAAKTKPKNETTMASIKPAGHMVYSAKQPNLLATKRCPISWRTKPKETATMDMRKKMIKLCGAKKAR